MTSVLALTGLTGHGTPDTGAPFSSSDRACAGSLKDFALQIDPRVVAREWLWFAGCLVFGLTVAFLGQDRLEQGIGIALVIYVLVTFIRLTGWAIRTLLRPR